MKKIKTYRITTFDQLLNVINKENAERFTIDVCTWLLMYADVINKYREAYPEQTKGKANIEIAKGAFDWIDDGKNDFKGFELKNTDTGEIINIKPKRK